MRLDNKYKANLLTCHLSHIMKISKKIGLRIKEIRLKKGITQGNLSKYSGIERTFISHIERGGRNISIETIEKIASRLGVSIFYLFNVNSFKK